ncbi:bacitracin ABC transporter ATP-binding protein [Paenibacillus sp. PK3_47]|uniref:ATP-binding cassette domain-containing protein n=1 Tax=Paenibacillus sp. PK3_47 TaxID=2072642 RepID=UPI00201E38E0|nr:ABC transporter ATP-binding protein [Paenibacillus sp. PK3_47]UQZ35122.1 bacitracin ABC transporter ATP-binding protein [Paenibacillus sp. PK3_47]
MNTPVLEAIALTKVYRSAFALREFNMRIEEGDIYGFVGENGAGKSTLMKIIGGLVHPESGELRLFGQQGKQGLMEARKRIGFLIERPSLYPHMNAEENLKFYCHIFGIRDPERIGEVLHAVGLTEAASKKTSQYSLGMRQRLGLAIALLARPGFLVLDEPVNGLDPAGILEMRRILERLAREQGVTVLVSSHILGELQLLATKYGFIHQGRLIREISAGELLQTARSVITLSTPDPAAAAEKLRQHLQLHNISVSDAGIIEIPKEDMDLERLMSVLLQQGIRVDGFNLSAPNLENYYMDLIGGGNK